MLSKEIIREMMECFSDCERPDLNDILISFLDDIDDKDYKPPNKEPKEPEEEYDSESGEEEELIVNTTPDGFHYLE
tara:strand:- start:1464 stop:1691 length:228 start_codon:yes stop_codon:yes gene_type:complete